MLSQSNLDDCYYVVVNTSKDIERARQIAKKKHFGVPMIVGYKKCGDKWKRGEMKKPYDQSSLKMFMGKLNQCDVPTAQLRAPDCG